MSNLVLVKPDNQHKTSFLAGFDELQSDSDRISWIYLGEAAFQDFFQINFDEYLTCDETNIASERTIIKNGGILQNIFIFEPNKPAKKRFWLNTK